MCEVNEILKQQVWQKAKEVDGYDPAQVRKDSCGAWIIYDLYNDRNSIFGWEIDHIYPLSELRKRHIPTETINNLDNLRPLNWLNNESKGSDYPAYHTSVQAEGEYNKKGDYQFVISTDLQETLKTLFSKYI